MSNLYGKKDLQQALKKAKLPWSYKAILKYERLGVIPRPHSVISRLGSKGDRVYTKEEMKEIVRKLSAHKKQ